MTVPISQMGVIGAGSWGTALAATAARAGHQVTLWARSAELCQSINSSRQNSAYLPGIDLPDNIAVTTHHADLAGCHALLVVTPAQAMRQVMMQFRQFLPDALPTALCSKGIEISTNCFMNEVLAEACPQLVPLVLSGPSFAADVARGLPTAVTLAASDLELARHFARALSVPSFRVYASNDLKGVELCGALKNVLAIACGICEGKKLGQSARAALITRGFAEMSRLATSLGAKPATLSGLAGLGDLILTCSSPQSRNFSLGLALGEGQDLDSYLQGRRNVTEGVHTARVVVELAGQHDIEMPICAAVNAIITGQLTADAAIAGLLARPVRPE